MMKASLAARLLALALTGMIPCVADANLLVEMSFKEKMTESDSVIVGTVTSTVPRHAGRYDASAVVSVIATLKGDPSAQLVVLTSSRIPEESPQCCLVGATYVMFLRRTPDGRLRSVNGPFGMIKIGPERSDPAIEVLRK